MIAEDLPGSFTDNSPEENIPVTPEPVQGQTEPMQGQTESMQGQAEPTPEQTEPAPGENGIQPQNPENAEGKDSESGSHLRRTTEALSRIFVILFAAAALVGLCIFGIQVNRRRVLKKRYRKFMQKDRNKAVCEISYGLYQMLWDAGIQEPDTGDVDYARKMEKALGILENGEYVKFIQLVQRAAYGSEQLTKEHHDACLEFYHRIAGYLWQQMTKRKKFRWKYMKCYEIS